MSTTFPALERLREAGALAPIDLHFARALARLTHTDDELAVLGAALASHAVGQGHVCADLAAIVQEPPYGDDAEPVEDFAWPPLEAWLESLRAAPFVAETPAPVPLILEGTRLYLARYCSYEKRLAAALLRRCVDDPFGVDTTLLDQGIARLFPNAEGSEAQQATAARTAVEGALAVISGGPGTGKTTTVARVLALIVEQAHATGTERIAIELLAPTGKAAQRLAEAIAKSIDANGIDDAIAEAIPREAATIHRRLGVRHDDPTRFRHDADNPLAADVVLVDEASMVDLALMTRLVEAVPPTARLIFLGDRDQLASVEAGAIFGDICLAGARPDSPLAPRTAHLTHRFRFDPDSPVGGLAEAIRAGDPDRTLALLDRPPEGSFDRPPEGSSEEAPAGRSRGTGPLPEGSSGHREDAPGRPPEGSSEDAPGRPPEGSSEDAGGGLFGTRAAERRPSVRRVDPGSSAPVPFIADAVVDGYRAMLQAPTPEAALRHLNDFRVLCAHRRGRFGVERVGEEIERLLVAASLLPAARRYGRTTDPWYPGRLIMVTQNDYQLDLFNGDVGIALATPGDPDRLRVWFPTGGAEARDVQPARLPAHETCFAMTIHKSQGSEFGGVAVVLPDKPSPVGTRELLYTAVTRARRDVTVVATETVVRDAVERRIVRTSGLSDML